MKIALCIPAHRSCEAKFTQCLASLVACTMGATIEYDGKRVVPEIEVFLVSCSLLTESRNRLVAEAIHWEADYMLWLDADHVFPRDSLIRLLSHNLPVVGCNYARRFTPTSPTASIGEELVWTSKDKADAEELEQVDGMGLGLCLIDMRVFGALEQRAEADGLPHFWPLFRIDPTEDGIRFIGEDVHFFRKIKEAGVPIHIDHGLSWDVGHVHETILTNAHTIVQKDKWVEHCKTKMKKFEEA